MGKVACDSVLEACTGECNISVFINLWGRRLSTGGREGVVDTIAPSPVTELGHGKLR